MSVPLSIPSPPEAWSQYDFTLFERTFSIHTYALCILAGIVVATIMTNARLKRRGAEPWVVLDIIIWAVPLGIVGARVYHVLTHPGDYFFEGADLLRTLYIWEGGNAIFGGLIGGAVGAWIGCRWTGIRFWTFADALAPGMLAAQALGRLGNWFNVELYGLPTTLPWGLEVPSSNPAFPVGLPADTLFHPTFLYEILWNVVGIGVILVAERRFRLQWGDVFGVYLVWYGIGRIWFESIRIDPSEVLLGLRTNVWAALIAVVIGLAIVIVQGREHTGDEPSPYRPGKEWKPEAAGVEFEGVESDSHAPTSTASGDDADTKTVSRT
ncbi:prolipoprotein diacylglyceryl transferase [Rathayibacter caricis]|uniref:prolipoprotein diacylglyceryl transferase n=1 Tax=Rathayibacter caricis TaxID=110936 RepID=UPI001FB2EFE6|nr:prolipoprotein diacylglyceryl transferase [Rathayibacter caricis]MCJ1694370.1 prolipoprotein diacylglyceryl transferase [Rathayibacter caricis]